MSLLEQLAAKAQVTGDVGESLDKELSAAEAEASERVGGAKALKAGTTGVSALMEHIRKDFEEEKFEGLEGKAIFDLLANYNRKAVECMLNFSEKMMAEALVANGKVAGLKGALEVVRKHHMASSTRAEQILKALAAEEKVEDEATVRAGRRERVPGEHPGF